MTGLFIVTACLFICIVSQLGMILLLRSSINQLVRYGNELALNLNRKCNFSDDEKIDK